MGLQADSFDIRSLTSLHSQASLQSIRLLAMKKSQSHCTDNLMACAGVPEEQLNGRHCPRLGDDQP